MPDENKVRYGLSNVHVGTVNVSEGTPKFSVPKPYSRSSKYDIRCRGRTVCILCG